MTEYAPKPEEGKYAGKIISASRHKARNDSMYTKLIFQVLAENKLWERSYCLFDNAGDKISNFQQFVFDGYNVEALDGNPVELEKTLSTIEGRTCGVWIKHNRWNDKTYANVWDVCDGKELPFSEPEPTPQEQLVNEDLPF